jgi:flagellar protein FliO/FliZ
MLDVLLYLLLTLVVAGALAFGVLLLRGYLTGTPATAVLFGPKPERRLAVVEQSSLDGRRKLVLIRRDDVEHLIMTGGPVDVIVETGICVKRAARVAEVVEAPAAVFTRAPRAFGQAAGEA